MRSFLFCLGFLALVPGAFAADVASAAPVKNEIKLTGQYFLLDQLDVRPVVKQQPQPRYPSDLSRDQIQGQVEVVFIIDAKGMPEEVQFATASHRSFGEAAVSAVKQWRFKPGRKGGVAVRTVILQRIDFNYGN